MRYVARLEKADVTDNQPLNKSVPLISNVSFDIASNNMLGIIGPNGAGKTSLVNNFFLDKRNKDYKNLSVRPDIISYVPQNYRRSLFPWLSIEKNSELYGKFRSFDYNKFADNLNKLKLNVPLERLVGMLSGGEQQILSISLATATQQSFLILDEPFSALDNIRKSNAISIIRSHLNSGGAGILISHNHDDLKELTQSVMYLNGVRGDSPVMLKSENLTKI